MIAPDAEVLLGVKGTTKFTGRPPCTRFCAEARDRARAAGAKQHRDATVLGAIRVHALSRLAKEVDADLLVVGNVGLSTRSGKWFGSVPGNVLARAKKTADALIVHTTD